MKKLKKIKEKEERAEYEKIPQRKLILKKNNIKVVEGLLLEKEKTKTVFLKPKEGKE